jgi:hypothetical protein
LWSASDGKDKKGAMLIVLDTDRVAGKVANDVDFVPRVILKFNKSGVVVMFFRRRVMNGSVRQVD